MLATMYSVLRILKAVLDKEQNNTPRVVAQQNNCHMRRTKWSEEVVDAWKYQNFTCTSVVILTKGSLEEVSCIVK